MKVKIKIKKKFHTYVVDEVVIVDADSQGNPYSRFWRNRLRDSVVDDCVEFVKDHLSVKKKSTKEIAQDANITT